MLRKTFGLPLGQPANTLASMRPQRNAAENMLGTSWKSKAPMSFNEAAA